MFLWWCSIHEIALLGVFMGPNSPKCCQILPKFSPELVFKESQTLFKELWKNPNFYINRRYPNLHVWSNFDPPFFPLKMAETEQNKKNSEKISVIRLIQICKRQDRISSSLQMKSRTTFWTFWVRQRLEGRNQNVT